MSELGGNLMSGEKKRILFIENLAHKIPDYTARQVGQKYDIHLDVENFDGERACGGTAALSSLLRHQRFDIVLIDSNVHFPTYAIAYEIYQLAKRSCASVWIYKTVENIVKKKYVDKFYEQLLEDALFCKFGWGVAA